MTRRSSLLVWALAGVALLGLYWLAWQNQEYLAQEPANQKYILNIALFVALLPLIVFAVRLFDRFTFDVVASRRRVHAPLLLREIVSVLLYMLMVAWAMWSIFEYRITTLLATGTVVAAILGLAMQETLGNLFSGIALHMDDSFEPGDVIRTGDTFGVVEAVRWRGTRLRTFNNNVVIVPNSMLSRERLEIYPRNNLNARVLQIGVDYNAPPAAVMEVLKHAAENVEGVSHVLPAFARVGGFGDSAVIYEIKYHMDDFSQRDRIDSEIRKAVWYALRRNGMSIPFPIRTLHRYTPPDQRQKPSTAEIRERLSGVDVLSPLPRDAQEALAGAARLHTYARGETIISHGEEGSSMFLVHQGDVSVRVEDTEVARLEAGDFFGEMALLTGEHRAADVIALNEVVAVEITREALEPILRDHPELAAAISASVAERRSTLDSHRADARFEEQRTILSRIRSYFGLSV